MERLCGGADCFGQHFIKDCPSHRAKLARESYIKEAIQKQAITLHNIRAHLPPMLQERERLIVKGDDIGLTASAAAKVKIEKARIQRWILRFFDIEKVADDALDSLKEQLRATM